MAYQNTNTELVTRMRAHAEMKKGVIPIDTEDLKRLCDLSEIALKADPKLETHGCDLPPPAPAA